MLGKDGPVRHRLSAIYDPSDEDEHGGTDIVQVVWFSNKPASTLGRGGYPFCAKEETRGGEEERTGAKHLRIVQNEEPSQTEENGGI